MMPTTESKTPLIDRFLELYRKGSTDSVDRALAIMLERNKEAIEPLFQSKDPCWLHKAFRQVAVCDNPGDDQLFWHLIHASKDFWSVLEFFWNHTLDKTFERRKGALLAEAEAKCASLLAALESVTLTQEQIDLGTTASDEQHAAARAVIAAVKGGV